MAQALRTLQNLPDTQTYYQELTKRNYHFIPNSIQEKLGQIKILVAGCGATGGACIEPLARLGVTHFKIADCGSYELNNLNRQHARIDGIGKNKAEFHKEELLSINPYIKVQAYPQGVTSAVIPEMVEWADFIIDAVDITTREALQYKFEMHAFAHKLGKPVVTGMDLGYCQWGISFDYRDQKTKVLNGQFDRAIKAKHPIKAWLEYIPLAAVPPHALQLVVDLLEGMDVPASQLGCASDLLSAIIVPIVVRFVKDGTLAKGWNINLEHLAYSPSQRIKDQIKAIVLRKKIKSLLVQLE